MPSVSVQDILEIKSGVVWGGGGGVLGDFIIGKNALCVCAQKRHVLVLNGHAETNTSKIHMLGLLTYIMHYLKHMYLLLTVRRSISAETRIETLCN